MQTVQYQGFYEDQFGKTALVFENDFHTLQTTLEGVRFAGAEFSDLALVPSAQGESALPKRFTFWEIKIGQTNQRQKILCNCRFEIAVPQTLIFLENMQNCAVLLTIACFLGKPQANGGLDREDYSLSLRLENQNFEGKGEDIETAFGNLQKNLGKKYAFKNCYACQYGDYSVYGNSAFGSMFCFFEKKELYLAVKSKEAYMALGHDFPQVQEIYLCDHFEPRKPQTGYRG